MSKELALQEVRTLATSSFKSGLFGIKNQEQAFTLMIIAQSEGVHPIRAMQMYDIIQGRPALKSTEVLTRFQKSGGKVKWIETTATKAKALFIHEVGGEVEHEYTIEDAKLANLTSKDNWKTRPKEMLRARCISGGIRMLYPACLNNMYSTDEVVDFDEPEVQVEEVVTVEDEPSANDLKRTLSNKLIKDYSFTNAIVKEFAVTNNLAENVELLEELVADDAKLTTYVENFEKGI